MNESTSIDVAGFSDGRSVAVARRMLEDGGDFLNDEVLACERLRAQRTVAVEGVDDAPIVCRGAEGLVFVTTETGRQMASGDGGKAFSPSCSVRIGSRPGDRVQAAGSLSSGAVVAAWGANGALAVSRTDGYLCNWRYVGRMNLEGHDRLEAAAGTRMVQLRDGSLLFAVLCDGDEKENSGELVVCRSQDEGKSWQKLAPLGRGCTHANLLELKTGELLAAITCRQELSQTAQKLGIVRENLLDNLVLARSTDNGKTWSDHVCVTRYGEATGDLVELRDGTVVLTYGQQNFPWGVRAICSRDGGRSWSDRFYVLGLSTVKTATGGMRKTEPGWHVSSIALPGDVILTVYNRGSLETTERDGARVERGKAVLAVRWTLEGMDLPPLVCPGVLAQPNAEGYLDNGRCLIKPEHMNAGGDYFDEDEILVCRRVRAEHVTIGRSAKGPIVTRSPDGDLFVACYFGEVYRSTDEGRTWKLITTRTLDEPIQSFGVLVDGTMLAQFMNGSVVRSEDGGRTWGAPIHIDTAPFDTMGGGNCMRINQFSGGPALLTCGNLGLQGHSVEWDGIFRSHDSGRTWSDFSLISVRACETNLLRLESGRMLAAIRTQGPHMTDDFIADAKKPGSFIKNVSLAVSDDEGYTWSKPWTVTRFFECPGDLVEMADGSVVLSYMQKSGASGPRAMVSRDEGKTWDTRFYILGWWPESLGHTSSVVLKDGNVITVTTDGANGHAIIWKPLNPV
jgi:hypothetical protein